MSRTNIAVETRLFQVFHDDERKTFTHSTKKHTHFWCIQVKFVRFFPCFDVKKTRKHFRFNRFIFPLRIFTCVHIKSRLGLRTRQWKSNFAAICLIPFEYNIRVSIKECTNPTLLAVIYLFSACWCWCEYLCESVSELDMQK